MRLQRRRFDVNGEYSVLVSFGGDTTHVVAVE